ncbi:MAG: cytochrome-c peroxidase [Cyclobacteriaceae bacterium]|nr:MAG: cytochrome-c peroxidase [Cyclobacteriaceae bacterium]
MIITPWLISLLVAFASCETSKEDSIVGARKNKVATINRALPMKVLEPMDNPGTVQKIRLGKLLFYDPILSGNRDVACATCHHPDNGYAEFLDISIGVNGSGLGSRRRFNQPNNIPFVKRNSQSILNTAFNGIDVINRYDPVEAPMFWDLRTRSLESQALEPIKALEEMRGAHFSEQEMLDEVVRRLKGIREYQELFEKAFGTGGEISEENIGKAIASFERTLVTTNSRFDKYLRGDREAISISEKEGFEIFKQAGCPNCHNGAMFSDFKPHVLGTPANHKLTEPDGGVDSTFAFRTPTLRNLRFTAPYMHNGSLPSLIRVLEFYEDISFGKSQHPMVTKAQFDPLVEELDLKVRDMAPIISFLNTLNDDDFDREIPQRVPSGLPVGGNIE